MAENRQLSQEEMIRVIEENIEKINKKDFNVYFFVLDTKGNPSGAIEYVYQTALTLQKKGYNVTMLHQEKEEFIGVTEWLGLEYESLPHKNIESENVEISPADFLFIPELFTNVMSTTKNLPCKRIIILQNYNYLAEFMPIGVTPSDMKIGEVITTTPVQAGLVHSFFPNVKTYVVPPVISKKFRPSLDPQKLVINVISKEQSDIKKVMQQFYWRFPMYKWVSFRELRGLPQDVFCDALRESAITIWMDDKTTFGYAALEAMRCGTILLAKIPQTLTDWNVEKNENGETSLTNACVWFDHIDSLPDVLASVVRTWTLDKIPSEVYEMQHKFDDMFTAEVQEKEIEKVYEDAIFGGRKKEFEILLSQVKNKNSKDEE